MKLIISTITLFCISICAKAQSINKQSLEVLEVTYQNCLDSGMHMLQCSEVFYNQMDYSLNVAYRSLYSQLSQERKSQLKSAQLKWLKERDKVFRIIAEEEKDNELSGADYQMSVLNRKAEYVKDRVLKLIDGKW